jgi:hypothetical protein
MEEVLHDRRVRTDLVSEDVDPVDPVDRLRNAVERSAVGRQEGVSVERVMPVVVMVPLVVMAAVVRVAVMMVAAAAG